MQPTRGPRVAVTAQDVLRFALEITALVGWGIVGWAAFDNSVARWLGVVGLPAIAAVAWGTFRVPGDASASGRAPVPVRGWVRLTIEVVVLLGAAAALLALGRLWFGAVLGGLVALHYVATWTRVRWLLAQ